MKKLMITGGNGFLGHHLLPKLDKLGIEYLAPKSSQVDLLNFNQTSDYLSLHKPDTILHMAVLVGGILANSNRPATFLYNNTQMALNIFEAARIHNIKNIYSLGSVCAYGNLCPTPFKEDDIWNGGAPEFTNRPFGQAKRTLMMLSETYRQQYGFTGAFLIPVNMYGEYDCFDAQNGHVIPALINKMVTAKKTGASSIECFGTGTATREFFYVGDCADAISKAIITNLDHNEPINLGSGKEILIKDLVYLIKDLIGYDGDVIFANKVSNGQPKRLLDTSRAKQLLGWEATTDFKDGLIKTIDYFCALK